MTIDEVIQVAITHQNAGRLQEAEQIYRQVLQQVPDFPDALHLLGVLAQQVGRLDVALELMSRAVQVQPLAPAYHSNLGELLRQLGRLDEAEATLRRAIELDPGMAVAYANLGTVLLDKGQMDEAETLLRRAVESDPNLPIAITTLGNVLLEKKDIAGAMEMGRRAVAMAPNLALPHNNLGAALERNRQSADAETEYRRAVELQPAPHFINNLGSLMHRQGRIAEAMQHWSHAAEVSPEFPDARWNLGLAHLSLGDYERGWELYEWRFKHAIGRPNWRDYPVPRWDGFDLRGKRILLYPEQGYGDVIMFSRFAAPLAERGAYVILHTPPEMMNLIRGVEGIAEVVSMEEKPPEFDTYQALLSLPWVLKTTLQTIPAKIPYIPVDPQRRAEWAGRVVADPGELKVGLVWAGRPTHVDDATRSIRLEELLPVLRVPRVRFFSLQMGEAAKELAALPGDITVTDLQQHLHDFTDTAAAIANLDLLISVDTAPVHVGGAIGSRVWTLLALAPDFRWLRDREDSPWYPTLRLFRQGKRYDWSDVVQQVRDALLKLV